MIQGKRIWDVTRIPDRHTSRVELTDLVRFEGAWYCGFREAEIHHAHPSGRGRIIRSSDGKEWETAALLDWDGADVREPRLSVTAEGNLMVNTSLAFVSKEPRGDGKYYQLHEPGTPQSDLEHEVTRQSATWLSPDGERWTCAYACPTGVNTWRWEVSWHNGMGYSGGYGGKDKDGTLYRTRDGKSWRPLLKHFFPGGLGNEASLAFDADNTAFCLLRDGRLRVTKDAGNAATVRQSDGHEIKPGEGRATHGASVPMFGIGKPPYYQEWEWKDVSVDWAGDGRPQPADDVFRAPLGGPKMIRLSDGRFFAVGRVLGPGRDDGHITLFRVDPRKAALAMVAEFDGTTYGGVAEHGGMIWVSYAARDTSAVFLANVKVRDWRA